MRGWKRGKQKYIIIVAEKVFAEGASTPFASLVTMVSVRFAIPTKIIKRMKKELKN
jgi:hypothetical protein